MRETTKFAGPLRECCELLRLEITLFSCFSFYYYYVNNRLDRFSGNNVVALHSSHKQHSTMSRFTLNDNQPKNTRNERTVIPHNSGNWYNRWWNITGTINATNGMLRIWFLSSRFVYLISGVRSIAWSDEKIELWSPVALYQANFSLLLLLLIFFCSSFSLCRWATRRPPHGRTCRNKSCNLPRTSPASINHCSTAAAAAITNPSKRQKIEMKKNVRKKIVRMQPIYWHGSIHVS